MGRVAWWGAAFAAAIGVGVAGCNDSREVAAPAPAQSGCASCHTAPGEAPPFRPPQGSDPQLAVGAHDRHLQGFLAVISCGECHRVPRAVADPGHLESSPEDIQFGPVATTGGAKPTYASPTCSAVYCHGNFAGGNRSAQPRWVGDTTSGSCGSCHGIPPPSGRHPEHSAAAVRCDECHGQFLSSTHVNGTVDVTLPQFDRQFKTCAQACHTPRSWPAPGDANL